MIILPDYQILTKIYESPRSVVYRGQYYGERPRPVILKILREEYPHLEELMRYQREYDLLCHLKSHRVVEAYALEKYHNTLVMVLEDFGGDSLKQYLIKQYIPLTESLSMAIQIVESLATIHAANIIHKDINPTNIIFNPITKQLKVNDFGIATRLPKENPVLKTPERLEGTLPYMSPEQTGRMNRVVDYRTDFYAFGVTLYELLTRRLPFEAENPIELVHCHLAKTPLSPHRINPAIPEMVSDIVMKLLEKKAENRYQSPWGIRTDLEICLKQLENTGHVELFVLGCEDVSDKFQLPQKLYGRDQEIDILLRTFEWASLGNTEMMLITGPAGVGKSTLVQEIYKPITEKRGYFITGKFDQLQRGVPYWAIMGAFRDLMRQLLTESEHQLAEWKEKLLQALGHYGQVIIEVVPELALIIGTQPTVVEILNASDAQNRFYWVWKNFLNVFCQATHPLVIFLDDLQWADNASLKLIHLIMRDTPYLMLIGAYQEEASHSLQVSIEEMKNSGVNLSTLSLESLNLSHLTQFLADTFNTSVENIYEFADLVFAKTQGNPFFVNEFLKSLHDENLLEFVPPYCEVNSKNNWVKTENPGACWRWDLEKIKARGILDNVAELLTKKIQDLKEDTQQVLKFAACIGDQFNLWLLAKIYEKPPKETIEALWEALVEGLVVPLKDVYEVMTPHEQSEVTNIQYRFVHDRIRQTVYLLLSEEQRSSVHHQTGKALLNHLSSEQSEQNIFAVVEQLNLGVALCQEQSEQDELAMLNLLVGRKAKAAGAYAPAFKYLKKGSQLLGDQCWQRQYELALALFMEASETAYLCGEFADMDALVNTVLQEANSLLDKIRIYEVKIQTLVAQNKLLEAIRLALTVLKLLEVHFPSSPSKWYLSWELLKTQFLLIRNRPPLGLLRPAKNHYLNHLMNLPKMTHPLTLATMRILSLLYSATYKVIPELFSLMALKEVQLSIKQGNAPESAFAYAAYGVLLCAMKDDIHTGYQFGQLALHLMDYFKELRAKILVIVNTQIKHWCEHIKDTLPPLQEAYQQGLETGEIEFAVMAANAYCHFAYLVGKNLEDLKKEIISYGHTITQLKHEGGMYLNNMIHQVILNLSEEHLKVPPYYLLGEQFNENKMLPLLYQNNDQSILCLFHFNKLHLCYLFEEYAQASIHAHLAEKYLVGLRGWVFIPLFYFYDSLIQLALIDGEISRRKIFKKLRRVGSNQKKIKRWAHYAPMNHLHKYYLVEAEKARVLGRPNLAREHFHKAIALTQEHGYPQEEALAYELTAKFYIMLKEKQLAHYYFRNAHHAYQWWGATRKTKELETRYSEVFFQTLPSKHAHLMTTSISYSTQQNISETLDIHSVLKASQAISEEIVLDRLLAKLIKIVIENSGAQRGILILTREGKLSIEICGEVSSHEHEVVILQPMKSSALANEDFPMTLVNYVARLKENIVLYDAAHAGRFTRDAYFSHRQVKSVLCSPLLYQGKLMGILYLENNLITGAFTTTRLEILNLLSSQMAASINNAQLYADTKALNSKLRESEERFRIIAETTPIPLIITRLSDDVILYANAQASAHLGLTITGSQPSMTEFYSHPDEQERIKKIFNRYGYIHNYELQLKKTDMSLVWVELFGHPIIYKHEKVLLTAVYDITDRKHAEEERIRFTQELSESEERFRVIAETTPIPFLIVRLSDSEILYANTQIESIFGLLPNLLMGCHHTADFYYHLDEQKRLLEIFKTEGFVKNYELQIKKINGNLIWVAVFIQPILFRKEKAMLWAFYDITDRKRAEEERIRFIQEREAKNAALRMNEMLQQEIKERKRAETALAKANEELSRLATLDGLTQLANRRRLDEYLMIEWHSLTRQQAPLSFILCDIDYFKRYNDNYGHQAGDDCLRQVARAMSRAVRRSSDMVARYGGEEFAVILPNTHIEGALKVAREMQREIQELKIHHASSEVHEHVTLSIGVATVIPVPTSSPEMLINIADHALYEAKRQGRNRIIFTNSTTN